MYDIILFCIYYKNVKVRIMNLKGRRNKTIIFGMIVTSIIYLIWRIFFTIPFGYGTFSLIIAFYLLIVEIMGMIEEIMHFNNMSTIEYPKRPVTKEKDFPHVDVFIATYNEPVNLLYKTVNGCKSMDYPDKSKVHIYLCDDSDRAEVKKLAHNMQINYLSRQDKNGAKAGNLNNALKNSTSPLVVTFDADMIPMHDFLLSTVPYFVEDLLNGEKIKNEKGIKEYKNRKNKIGFVQTPQHFYNADLFQYNLFSEFRIPNEQDYFYRDIEVSKNKNNSVIYGGSNTVIAREALEDIGGFYTKVITEDFATGMLIQSKGYKTIAIDEIHASGLSPEDLKGLIKQRIRWARGCIQSGRKLNILFRKGLTLSQKLSYISSILYWYSPLKRLIYIMCPILYAVFGVVSVKCTTSQVLIFWLPMHILSRESLKLFSNNIRTIKWSNVYDTILFPALFFPVIFETFGISKSKFEVTRKSGAKEDKHYQLIKSIPHIIFAILSIIGIYKCIKITFEVGSPVYVVLLFWLVVNLYTILMSIFFMLGRKVHRKAERFLISEQCEIIFQNESQLIKCISLDISETGMSILLNEPKYIPYDNDVLISINTARYKCTFNASIVHVDEYSNKWKYAFVIKNISNNNYNNLLNIIHDRVPNMPKSISENNSIFDDLRINILNRNKGTKSLNRKLPRINLNKKINALECHEVTIYNYNYECFLLKVKSDLTRVDKISIEYGKNKYIECFLQKSLPQDKDAIRHGYYRAVYKIQDYKKLINDKDFNIFLFNGIEQYNKQLQNKNGVYNYEFDEMQFI